MEHDTADTPAEVWKLRREFHSLRRRLRSGQQKLRSSVRSLNAATENERAAPRSSSRRHRTKTSTPKVPIQRPVSTPRDHVTPVCGVASQRPGPRRSADPGTSWSGSRQRSGSRDPSLSFGSVASSSTEGVEVSAQGGSPLLRDPQHRRLERLSGRGGGKENKGAASGKRKRSANRDRSLGFGPMALSSTEGSDISSQEQSPMLLRLQCRRSERLLGKGGRERCVEETSETSTVDERSDVATCGNGASPRPRSILMTPGTRLHGKTPNRVAFVDRLNQLSVKRQRVSEKDRSLLGYDWIAGVLESGSDYAARSDQYFEELRQFRRTHRDDCVHDTVSELSTTLMDSTLPPKPEDEESSPPQPTHKCIHNYHLNSRLFPMPLHEARDGESLCAICRDRKKERPTRASPAYIRVSIPRSTLVSPYKVRSHRRRSYDPTDSLGLSQHCLTGWQNSKPSMMPTASNIDLKSALGPQTRRSNFNPTDEGIPPTRRIPRMSKRTQELMNRSLALQLDAHKLGDSRQTRRAGTAKTGRTKRLSTSKLR